MQPFEQAWRLLKELPESIVPIGRYGKRNIAMLNGRPMYTSTATAKDSEGKTKNFGQYYDFAGIEPDFSQWSDDKEKGQGWYVKGGNKDIPKHAALDYDLSQNTMQNQSLQHHLKDYDFEELPNIQEVNQRLFNAGYDLSHLKGHYDALSPFPQQPAAMSQPSMMDTQVMPNTELATNLAPTVMIPFDERNRM
jgi:hypothetical protein|tara:strand:- start:1071 stop:1649 length:579 start_codon:yes stop_codon:yes gene_type:complete